MAISDPVALDVPALSDLAVSIFLPGPAAATTEHPWRPRRIMSQPATTQPRQVSQSQRRSTPGRSLPALMLRLRLAGPPSWRWDRR
jgi:hypothetical protein